MKFVKARWMMLSLVLGLVTSYAFAREYELISWYRTEDKIKVVGKMSDNTPNYTIHYDVEFYDQNDSDWEDVELYYESNNGIRDNEGTWSDIEDATKIRINVWFRTMGGAPKQYVSGYQDHEIMLSGFGSSAITADDVSITDGAGTNDNCTFRYSYQIADRSGQTDSIDFVAQYYDASANGGAGGFVDCTNGVDGTGSTTGKREGWIEHDFIAPRDESGIMGFHVFRFQLRQGTTVLAQTSMNGDYYPQSDF